MLEPPRTNLRKAALHIACRASSVSVSVLPSIMTLHARRWQNGYVLRLICPQLPRRYKPEKACLALHVRILFGSRENKVWRGLSPAFGVVRLYRTFSFYSIAGETRCAGFGISERYCTYTIYMFLCANDHTSCCIGEGAY